MAIRPLLFLSELTFHRSLLRIRHHHFNFLENDTKHWAQTAVKTLIGHYQNIPCFEI